MPSYITTLQDDTKTNDLLPRTVLKAIADDNSSYLDNTLTASDINALKNGKIATIVSDITTLQTGKLNTSDVYNALDRTASGKALDARQGKALNDKVVGVRGSNSAYSDSATYAVGDYAIYNETLYRCKTAIATPESFDSTKWDAVDLKTNRDAINAIMTESSNSIKFRDGTMLYWNSDTFSPTQVGFNNISTPSLPFVSIFSCFVSCYQENMAGIYVSNTSINHNMLDLYFYCPSASYTVHYSYLVIGRWK